MRTHPLLGRKRQVRWLRWWLAHAAQRIGAVPPQPGAEGGVDTGHQVPAARALMESYQPLGTAHGLHDLAESFTARAGPS